MQKNSLALSFLPCLLLAGHAFAATNPVDWSLYPSSGFPSQTVVGNSYAASYTLSNNLPFPVTLSVTTSYTGGTFTLTNGCNTTLAAKGQANSSCLVHIGLQPIAARTNSIILTMAYDNNRIPLPALSSTSTSSSNPDRISGHVTTPLPAVTYTGTSYPVEFSYVNNGTTTITATSVSVSGFTALTNTCTSPLAPNTPPCTITGSFSPVSTGQTTLGTTYTYYNGSSVSIPLSTTTNVHSGSGDCHHVSGSVYLSLPTSTFQYADNVVRYTFTNNCDTSSETLGNFTASSDGSATLTKGTDNCSGKTLAANSSCSVYVSVVPTTINADLSVTAAVPYQSNTKTAYATTSEAVKAVPSPTTLHTVMFVNQCSQDVWYEFANGVGGANSPDPTPANQRSYFDYQLPQQVRGAAPSTKVLSFNEYINGNIFGRTLCDINTGFCQTANCAIQSTSAPYTDWSCQPGKGVTGPATLLEEYMPSTTDYDGVYDVTVINGLNIPAEMKSLAPLSSDPFGCGQAAGAVIQPTGSSLGACSWSFSPPSTGIDSPPNFIWVTPGADDACTPSTFCGNNQFCGTAYDSVTAVNGGLPPLNRRCGHFLGYWQIGDFITYPSSSDWGSVNLYDNYSLAATLSNGPDGPYGTIDHRAVNYGDIYTCPVATSNGSLNTGYNTGDLNVCGCEDWTYTASATTCKNHNVDWKNIAFPRVSWIKQACPTAYTYQFDDPSSSFTCQISGQKTSYIITYCPAGKTGKPGT